MGVIDYSVIIPAYNEEELLPSTLTALKVAMATIGYRGEIIVVDNNSSDKTADLARAANAQVVFEKHNQISRARNRGAKAAQGQYLIFIDADTIVPKTLLSAAISSLTSGNYCGGGARIGFDQEPVFILRQFCSFWDFTSRQFNLAAGSFIFCLKEAFNDVGGFSEEVYASEEVWLSMALAQWGRNRNMQFTVLNQFVVTSSRKFNSHSTLHISLLIFLLGLFPWLTRSKRFCSFWYPKDR